MSTNSTHIPKAVKQSAREVFRKHPGHADGVYLDRVISQGDRMYYVLFARNFKGRLQQRYTTESKVHDTQRGVLQEQNYMDMDRMIPLSAKCSSDAVSTSWMQFMHRPRHAKSFEIVPLRAFVPDDRFHSRPQCHVPHYSSEFTLVQQGNCTLNIPHELIYALYIRSTQGVFDVKFYRDQAVVERTKRMLLSRGYFEWHR